MADQDETNYRVTVEAGVQGAEKSSQSLRDMARAIAATRKEVAGLFADLQKLTTGLKNLTGSQLKAFQRGRKGIAIASAGAAHEGAAARLAGLEATFSTRAGAPAVSLEGGVAGDIAAGVQQQAFEHGANELRRNKMYVDARSFALSRAARRRARDAREDARIGRLAAGARASAGEREMQVEAAWRSQGRRYAGVPSADELWDAQETADEQSRGRLAPAYEMGGPTPGEISATRRQNQRVKRELAKSAARNFVSSSASHMRSGGPGAVGAVGLGLAGRGYGGVPMAFLDGGGDWHPAVAPPKSPRQAGGGGRPSSQGIWLYRDISQIGLGVAQGAGSAMFAPAFHGAQGIGGAIGGAGQALGGLAGIGIGGLIGGMGGGIVGGFAGLGAGAAIGNAFGSIVQGATLLGGQGLDFRRQVAGGLFGLDPQVYTQALLTAAHNKDFSAWRSPYRGTRTRSWVPGSYEQERVYNPARQIQRDTSGWGPWQDQNIDPTNLEMSLFGILNRGRSLGYSSQETVSMMARVQASSGGWANDSTVMDAQNEALLLQRGLGVSPEVTGRMARAFRRGGLVGGSAVRGFGGLVGGLYQSGGSGLGGQGLGLAGPLEFGQLYGYTASRADVFSQTGRRFAPFQFLEGATGLADRGLGSMFGLNAMQGFDRAALHVAQNGPQDVWDVMMLRTAGGLPNGPVGAGALNRAMRNLESGGIQGGMEAFLRNVAQSAGGVGSEAATLLMHLKKPFGDFGIDISRALAGGAAGPFGRSGGEYGTMSLAERALMQTGGPALPEAARQADAMLRVGLQLTETMLLLNKASEHLIEKVGKAAASWESAALTWDRIAEFLAESVF